LLTYVDEAYSKDRYYVVGLGVHHEDIRVLETAISDVVRWCERELGTPTNAELHGHQLFHGKGPWEGLEPRQRIAVYGKTFEAIAVRNVSIFLRGVDMKRLNERYINPRHPHDVCLQHLMERVNDYCDQTSQAALIIADELHEHDRHRRALKDFKAFGTPGYLSSKLPRIVDTIHFAPSHHSRLLQAADLVAFLHHRRSTRMEVHPKAAKANEALWKSISGRIVHAWTWSP